MIKQINALGINWLDESVTSYESFLSYVDQLKEGIYYFSGRSGTQMNSIGLTDGNYFIKVYAFREDRVLVEAISYGLNTPIYAIRKYSGTWSATWQPLAVNGGV